MRQYPADRFPQRCCRISIYNYQSLLFLITEYHFKGNVISCLEQEKQQKVIEIHVLYEHLRNILHAILFYTHTICCLQGQNPPSFCFARKTTRLSSSFTSSIGRNGTTMSKLVFMIQYICSSSLSSPPNPSSSAKYCPSG